MQDAGAPGQGEGARQGTPPVGRCCATQLPHLYGTFETASMPFRICCCMGVFGFATAGASDGGTAPPAGAPAPATAALIHAALSLLQCL